MWFEECRLPYLNGDMPAFIVMEKTVPWKVLSVWFDVSTILLGSIHPWNNCSEIFIYFLIPPQLQFHVIKKAYLKVYVIDQLHQLM